MIGKTLSHYRIVDKLGEGGMGVVYRAEDTRLRRTVALKLLSTAATEEESARNRFLHEAQAASALDHPNICTVYEIDEAEGQLFIAMAYVEGRTLKARIQEGPLPLPEALDIAAQIAAGLAAAHEHGTVHRDIKSANIILTEKDQVKLLDFGLAKLQDRTQLTADGTVMGTAAYMSPEQARGEEVDRRTDIWSLGVILHEMIAGRLPFAGGSDQAMLYGIQFVEPEPLTALRTGVPLDIERMVAKALAKDPGARYQHADELLTDIRRFQQSQSDSAWRRRPPGSDRRRGRRLKIAAGIAMPLLALIAGAAILLTPSQSIPFAKRDWILIADFANETGEAVFQGTIREALSIDLQQSQHVNVFAGQRLDEALQRTGREDLSIIDADLAREIAIREGLTAILVGSISKIGESYLLSAKIINPVTGDAVDTRRVRADSQQDVLSSLDKLSHDIRRNLGESLLSIGRRDQALAQVSTVSLPALRQYTLGVKRTREAKWSEAIALLKEAVAQDSTFAAAYHSLGVLHHNLARTAEALRYSALARQHSDRVTERERYLIIADYYRIRNEYAEAIDQYELLIQLYPDDFVAHNNLCFTYQFTRQYPEALRQSQQIARLDPQSWYVHHNAALAHAGIGDSAEAVAEFEQGLHVNEQAYWSRIGLSWIHIISGDLRQAWEELDGPSPPGPAWSSLRENSRALIWRYLGDDLRAAEHLQKAIATDEGSGNGRAASGKLVILAQIQRRCGQQQDALASLERAVELNADAQALNGLGQQLGELGRDAAFVLRRLQELCEREPTNFNRAHLQQLRGDMARKSDQAELAVRELALSLDYADMLDTRLILAETYRSLDDPDRARPLLEYIVQHQWATFFDGIPEIWPLALFHLGEICQAQGEGTEAIEHLNRFLELWGDSESHRTEVERARRYLAELSG